ncbi:hypothetical protein N0V88_006196 [Collariella sp. IMI 366227]|nr:hypothetical protein N0V88_006196 [Collariella sp. IMI 366227]
MPPPILFLEMKLHNPVPDEPAFTEADYELYAEMGQLEELIEIDPNESMSAVDVRFANEVHRYRKQDLVDGWPYFKSIVEKAFVAGRLFHRHLADLAVRALIKHCDAILMDAFHQNGLDMIREDVIHVFQLSHVVAAAKELYTRTTSSKINTVQMREIVVPYICVLRM